MPVNSRSPYVAEWNTIQEESGKPGINKLQVESILDPIAKGATVSDLMKLFNASQEVIEHLIMMIPHMMVWREDQPPEVVRGERLPRGGDAQRIEGQGESLPGKKTGYPMKEESPKEYEGLQFEELREDGWMQPQTEDQSSAKNALWGDREEERPAIIAAPPPRMDSYPIKIGR